MKNDLISREALKKAIEKAQYTQEFCIEHQIDFSISMQMLGLIIDNAPTVEYPFYAEAYQTGYKEGKNETQKYDDLCKTCKKGDDCELSTKIFSGCRTTNCYKYEEVDNGLLC